MTGTIELARFEVDPGKADAIVAAHAELVEILREHAPRLIRLVLVRLDERTWLDVAEWTSREDAEAAAAVLHELPGCRRFFALMDADHPVEYGAVVSDANLAAVAA